VASASVGTVPASSVTMRRLGIAGVCLASLALCCGLAWWQWERFSSASGTFQNLGYVLQWPLFGLFPAFMFWRIRKLRRRAEEADAREQAGGETAATVVPEVPAPRQRRAPAPRPPAPEDDELAAYNRYLRELNARDQ
jgi:DNA-binding transcriptional regulator of glucitol operon